ncbi:MAG TPA: hypothetical protein EYH14_02440 [Euryarchaeota archaeon]|nr:hypothetical protein [Euryarchaeota archaeon]
MAANPQSLISSRWEAYRKKHLTKYRLARSRGAVDPAVVPLLDLINASPHYVTTSSCSGRIVLLSTGPTEKKGESFFYRKWHRPVLFEEVWDALKAYSGATLWFKFDPFIIHIGARGLGEALRIVSLARSAGVKIAGVQSADSSKYHVEIRGIDSMAVPVYDGELLVDRRYVKALVRFANKKMARNAARLSKLFSVVSTGL